MDICFKGKIKPIKQKTAKKTYLYPMIIPNLKILPLDKKELMKEQKFYDKIKDADIKIILKIPKEFEHLLEID